MSKFVDIKYGHGLEHTVNAYKSPIAECLDFFFARVLGRALGDYCTWHNSG